MKSKATKMQLELIDLRMDLEHLQSRIYFTQSDVEELGLVEVAERVGASGFELETAIGKMKEAVIEMSLYLNNVKSKVNG